eukprot:61226-Karenia_brevis.AAC.1
MVLITCANLGVVFCMVVVTIVTIVFFRDSRDGLCGGLGAASSLAATGGAVALVGAGFGGAT